MKNLLVVSVLALLVVSPARVISDEGINCDTLPVWSQPIEGYQVNLHHVFCGEAGRGKKAKGFHAMPGGIAPNSYHYAEPGSGTNSAGVYTLKKIKLVYDGKTYFKSFSSMFPKHCQFEQVNSSIVYSLQNSQGRCARPRWARCGPSGPEKGPRDNYCIGLDGKPFLIASALKGKKRINTGFPIYRRK